MLLIGTAWKLMASHKNGLLSVSRKMVALLMITRCKIYRAGFIHWIRVGWSPSELARATDSSSQPQQLNFPCTITNIKPMPSEMVVALCLKVNTLHSLCIHNERIPLFDFAVLLCIILSSYISISVRGKQTLPPG